MNGFKLDLTAEKLYYLGQHQSSAAPTFAATALQPQQLADYISRWQENWQAFPTLADWFSAQMNLSVYNKAMVKNAKEYADYYK